MTKKRKREEDSSPASSPQPSTSGTQVQPERSLTPQPSTSGHQVNAALPERISSPQPSTSGTRAQPERSLTPQPSTSGHQVNATLRERSSSPQPSTSGTQAQPERSSIPQPFTSGPQGGEQEAHQMGPGARRWRQREPGGRREQDGPSGPPGPSRRRVHRFSVQITLSPLGRPTVEMPAYVPLANQAEVMAEVWGWWINSPFNVEMLHKMTAVDDP